MYHYSITCHKTLAKLFAVFMAFSMIISPLFVQVAYGEEVPAEQQTEAVEEPEQQVEEQQPQEEQEEEQQEEQIEPAESVVSDEPSTENSEENEDEESEELGDGGVVVTGDAVSGAENENVANFNNTTVGTSSSTSEDATTSPQSVTTETASSTASSTDDGSDIEDGVDEPLSGGSNALPGDTTSSTTNDAVLENNATSSAGTGGNGAGNDGVIATGDAIAYANVVNLVNTNIFNSNGLIAFFSSVFGISSIDLRDAFSSIFGNIQSAVSTPICGYEICTGGNTSLTINNLNNATITNNVNVTANTGGNTAGDGGTIVTGDAYAAANVFNLANTNITDSSYLILSFNNFGDYAGDIVLPNSGILDALFGANGTSYNNVSNTNTNTADIDNSMTVGSDTGNNEAGGGGLIVTGDAESHGSVSNTVNTNLFGGSDLILVLRVHGDWNGEIFGLPDGMEWAETGEGIVLYSTGNGAAHPSSVGELTVNNTNNATINNNVSVFALTGDNKVGDGGTIVTGDAYAAANITNVANTNILGQNWALLVFDIFGNWNGNLAFGQPNLWVGAKATPKTTPVMPGTEVEYTFTVMNRGDSLASNVVLDNVFKQHELSPLNLESELTNASGRVKTSWNIGDLRPGESKNITLKAKVGSSLPKYEEVPVSLDALAYARENDANNNDNYESITIYSGHKPAEVEGSMVSFPANIEVTKTGSSDVVLPGSTVDYTIVLKNHGGPLFRSMLRDVMTYEDGEMISEQYWELGTILTDEEITIEYTMEFGEDMKPGTYTNKAETLGLSEQKSWRRGDSYTSPAGEYTITLGGDGQVLGASTDLCPAYLHTFMKAGVSNNTEEVLKLQKFLNYELDADIAENGFFGFETEIAVKNFQSAYRDDVLTPWGMSDPSGYVYLTTRKKINELSCENSREFPLSNGQKAEIERFRIGVERLPENTTSPLPLFGDSGTDENSDEVTLDDTPEAIKNEVAIVEEKKPTPPTTPSDDDEIHPVVSTIMKAFNWFRDLTPVASAFSE